MPVHQILPILSRAALWAPAAAAAFLAWRWLFCRIRGKNFNRYNELWLTATVFYLVTLFLITVSRPGIDWLAVAEGRHRGRYGLQLIPFFVTIKQLRGGWLKLFYPVAGNIAWFIPLGILLPSCWQIKNQPVSGRKVLLISLLVSLGIETLQWLWGTGVSDIDDVIFNVIGGILGYGLYRLFARRSDWCFAHCDCRKRKDLI